MSDQVVTDELLEWLDRLGRFIERTLDPGAVRSAAELLSALGEVDRALLDLCRQHARALVIVDQAVAAELFELFDLRAARRIACIRALVAGDAAVDDTAGGGPATRAGIARSRLAAVAPTLVDGPDPEPPR